MSNLAIIAEFNPFHNGHNYLLNKAKSRVNPDYTYALMSGNFVQRGEPAIFEKYTRAAAAVCAGFDAVFELPAFYALGSARDFADGAISLLNKTGSTDYLAFGVETEDYSLFNIVSTILAEEPETFKYHLKTHLANGESFPLARCHAIEELAEFSVTDFLTLPNNILALSYMTALKKTHSKIKPILIKRTDVDHDSNEFTKNYASARLIRENLARNLPVDRFIPPDSYNSIKKMFSSPLTPDVYLKLLSFAITEAKIYRDASSLQIWDISEDLMNRFSKANTTYTYNELCNFLKTRNETMSHIHRACMHLLLRFTDNEHNIIQQERPGYLNLLSLKSSSSELIRMIQENSSIPVITKKSAFMPSSHASKVMWAADQRATALYQSLLFQSNLAVIPSELSSTVKVI